MNDKETPKEASKRSPNYPSVNLEESLTNTRTIFERDKLAGISADVLVGHLGYNKLHGTSRRVLSSMKSYGLIDELGGNRYKVSENAYKLIHSDLNSPKAVELLREAALKPAICRSVIEEYKGDLPSDRTVISYLVLDKGFTHDSAQSFATVLRENAEFANITSSDFTENPVEKPTFQEGSNMIGQQSQQHNQPPVPPAANQNPAAQNFGLPIPETNETVLNFKISRKSEARIIFYGEEVTQEAIDHLSTMLLAQKPVYPSQAELEAEKNQPKSATWKSKDYDHPVNVTGELGEKDGKKFYSIEESKTGISEDELDFGDSN